MADADLTIAVLREIRDEVRGTNTRLDRVETSLGGRIDHLEASLGGRIDHLEASLGARIDETNSRLGLVEHTLQDLATQQ